MGEENIFSIDDYRLLRESAARAEATRKDRTAPRIRSDDGRSYILGEVCGVGGTSVVNMAYCDGALLALKSPHPKFCDTDLLAINECFEEEAAFIDATDHPNLVSNRIGRERHYHFERNGRVYIPLEYLKHPLEKLLRYPANDDDYLRRLFFFMTHAARAMEHLHESRMVHCDIKPSQFRVTHRGKVKLYDLSSIIHEGRRLPDKAIITKQYFPKKMRRSAMRPCVDLYCFGNTLLDLLSPIVEPDRAKTLEKLEKQRSEEVLEDLMRANLPSLLLNGIIANCLESPDKPSFTTEKLGNYIELFGLGYGYIKYPDTNEKSIDMICEALGARKIPVQDPRDGNVLAHCKKKGASKKPHEKRRG